MKQLIICVVLFTLTLSEIKGQLIEIKGIVIDSITSQPIAFASVGVKKMGLGTLTNQQGSFRLKLPFAAMNQRAEIQILGYKTHQFTVTSTNANITCRLASAPTELNEVIVFPRDTLLNLLKLAYVAIPRNYPTQPVMYTGFYREVQKANDTLYLNFIEAILDINKNTYKTKSDFGQVRIVKSRKNNFPGIDTINNVRFYGGPHITHTLDFVFHRKDFINPKHFKNYNYYLTEQKVIGNNKVYCIDFKHKNDSISGTLYIDKRTLAYIGLDRYRKTEESNPLNSYKALDSYEKIGYKEFDGKWHLSYIVFNANGINSSSNKKIFHHLEYVTTSIQTDSVKPIPLHQEFGYLDFISVKADDYAASNWTDYNILEQDSILSAQDTYGTDESLEILKNTQPIKKNNKDQIITIIKRFRFDFGIAYQPVHSVNGSYHAYYQDDKNNSLVKDKTLSSYDYSLGLYSKMSYSINKQWSIFYASTGSFNTNQSYVTDDIGFQYTTPVFKNNRKWIVDLGLCYGHAQYNLQLGNAVKTGNTISINDKQFDANKINVLWGKGISGIKPLISLNYRIGEIAYLFVSASTVFELNSSDQITFKEKSGFFLTRKNQKVSMSDNQLDLSIDNNPVSKANISAQPYQLNFGLSIRL